jgi:hypothetical protein
MFQAFLLNFSFFFFLLQGLCFLLARGWLAGGERERNRSVFWVL